MSIIIYCKIYGWIGKKAFNLCELQVVSILSTQIAKLIVIHSYAYINLKLTFGSSLTTHEVDPDCHDIQDALLWYFLYSTHLEPLFVDQPWNISHCSRFILEKFLYTWVAYVGDPILEIFAHSQMLVERGMWSHALTPSFENIT